MHYKVFERVEKVLHVFLNVMNKLQREVTKVYRVLNVVIEQVFKMLFFNGSSHNRCTIVIASCSKFTEALGRFDQGFERRCCKRSQ